MHKYGKFDCELTRDNLAIVIGKKESFFYLSAPKLPLLGYSSWKENIFLSNLNNDIALCCPKIGYMCYLNFNEK